MADGPLGSPLPGRMRLRLAPPPSLATNTSAALLVSPDTRLAASEVKATRLPSPLMAGLRLFPVAAVPWDRKATVRSWGTGGWQLALTPGRRVGWSGGGAMGLAMSRLRVCML